MVLTQAYLAEVHAAASDLEVSRLYAEQARGVCRGECSHRRPRPY